MKPKEWAGVRAIRGAVESNRYFAFTLVELLVVISIIAILASLILPALSRAKVLAQSVKCRSNLHQLAIAEKMYIDDNGGVFSGYDAATARHGDWASGLDPYAKVNNKGVSARRAGLKPVVDVFACPTDRYLFTSGRQGRFGYGPELSPTSYGYNIGGRTSWSSTGNYDHYGLGGFDERTLPFWSVDKPHFPNQVPESEVKVPSDMLMFGDGCICTANPLYWPAEVLLKEFGIDPDPAPITARFNQKTIIGLHGGKLSWMFVDGHAEVAPLSEVYGSTWLPDFSKTAASDRWLKRWNRDNQPH